MLLSNQQRYMLEILQKLVYLRQDQLQRLVQRRWPDLRITAERMEIMLRQLKSGTGNIRQVGNVIYISRMDVDALYLEAIDVMLELSCGNLFDFRTDLPSPYLLRFLTDRDPPGLFSIAALVLSEQSGMIERSHEERIIWITDSGTAPPDLFLPKKHFFAARQADGTHRFYGSGEP